MSINQFAVAILVGVIIWMLLDRAYLHDPCGVKADYPERCDYENRQF